MSLGVVVTSSDSDSDNEGRLELRICELKYASNEFVTLAIVEFEISEEDELETEWCSVNPEDAAQFLISVYSWREGRGYLYQIRRNGKLSPVSLPEPVRNANTLQFRMLDKSVVCWAELAGKPLVWQYEFDSRKWSALPVFASIAQESEGPNKE